MVEVRQLIPLGDARVTAFLTRVFARLDVPGAWPLFLDSAASHGAVLAVVSVCARGERAQDANTQRAWGGPVKRGGWQPTRGLRGCL